MVVMGGRGHWCDDTCAEPRFDRHDGSFAPRSVEGGSGGPWRLSLDVVCLSRYWACPTRFCLLDGWEWSGRGGGVAQAEALRHTSTRG